jgi:adenylate cyclase class 2
MRQARRETEVKLRFDSPEEARRSLERLKPRLSRERHFEDNQVFDLDDRSLVGQGKLLRLRRTEGQAVLTFKAPVEGQHRHKVREEHESAVERPDAIERLLEGLGFRTVYRYQKYRTLFETGELHICLDETPLGCFVELEGPPEAIDAAAVEMGVGQDRYLVETYRELQERVARERGVEPGDLVFDGPELGR